MNESLRHTFDLVCFSHLRYNSLHNRPRQILSRFARFFRTFEIEETVFEDNSDRYDITLSSDNVVVVKLHLRGSRDDVTAVARQQQLLETLFAEENIQNYIFWYYTPAALTVSEGFNPLLVVYDCIGKWPVEDREVNNLELELFTKADLVFTDGQNLYEHHRQHNLHTYSFPSSIDFDVQDLSRVQPLENDPPDQDSIPHPRIGFHGVLDDRIDINLVEEMSKIRSDWQFILIGPLVNMEVSRLSHYHNIYYLGDKSPHELPAYLSGWDIALVPVISDHSRFSIEPKDILEYLALGIPVVTTQFSDPILAFKVQDIIQTADTAAKCIQSIEQEFIRNDKTAWQEKVKKILEECSWDYTWKEMMKTICTVTRQKINFEAEKIDWVNSSYVL